MSALQPHHHQQSQPQLQPYSTPSIANTLPTVLLSAYPHASPSSANYSIGFHTAGGSATVGIQTGALDPNHPAFTTNNTGSNLVSPSITSPTAAGNSGPSPASGSSQSSILGQKQGRQGDSPQSSKRSKQASSNHQLGQAGSCGRDSSDSDSASDNGSDESSDSDDIYSGGSGFCKCFDPAAYPDRKTAPRILAGMCAACMPGCQVRFRHNN